MAISAPSSYVNVRRPVRARIPPRTAIVCSIACVMVMLSGGYNWMLRMADRIIRNTSGTSATASTSRGAPASISSGPSLPAWAAAWLSSSTSVGTASHGPVRRW